MADYDGTQRLGASDTFLDRVGRIGEHEHRGTMSAHCDAAGGELVRILVRPQRLFRIVCIQVIAEREAALTECLAGHEAIGPSGYTACDIPFEGSLSLLVGPRTVDVGNACQMSVRNASNVSNRITAVWYNFSPFVHAQAPGQPTIVDALQAQQMALEVMAQGFNARLDTIEKNSRYGSAAEAAQANARKVLRAQQEDMMSHNRTAVRKCKVCGVPLIIQTSADDYCSNHAPSPKPQAPSDDEWHAWSTPSDES